MFVIVALVTAIVREFLLCLIMFAFELKQMLRTNRNEARDGHICSNFVLEMLRANAKRRI